MAGATKKAAGYIQVKLIPADRNGQTWSGWTQRWVDLLVVSEDSGLSKRDRNPEVWLEIRKSKSSGKPLKQWTVDAKDTVLYRCTSKRKGHAFAIQYRGKDIVYLSGNSESESNDWMKIIRETLCPTNKIVELEVSTERLFEASVIDNAYSASCGLFGKYGHLACRENKLIMFDNNGSNVIQEWYLHTVRKLEAFEANANDKSQILTVYLGENSSTGCGVIYYYCPKAVSLLKSIRTRIQDIFDNIADDLKVQQATLMSLGALHDVSLEESEVKDPLMKLIIADEIIKAKQELSQSKRLQALKPPVPEATNKNEPFIWKDNEFYEEDPAKEPGKDPVKVTVRADYTPPDDEPPKKPRRGSLTQSLSFMKRPRAQSTHHHQESSKFKAAPRRMSLPHSGRFHAKSPTQAFENEMELQMQKFQHILNLADSENSEQIFPLIGATKSRSRAGSGEPEQGISTLGALDECSDENTSRSASLSSFNLSSVNEDKTLDAADSKPAEKANPENSTESVNLRSGSEDSKTDNEDSLTEELVDVTIESTDPMNLKASSEPELDLRLRQPDDEDQSETSGGEGPATAGDVVNQTLDEVAGERLQKVMDKSVAQSVNQRAEVVDDGLDAQVDTAATIDATALVDAARKASTHAVTINFGPPPKPQRTSKTNK